MRRNEITKRAQLYILLIGDERGRRDIVVSRVA